MSLVEELFDTFDVSVHAASTLFVEEDIYTYSCVIVILASKFSLSYALIMAAVRERILLV